jgi:hypothetical protein
MDENLVGYAIGGLDAEEAQAVAEQLEHDPALAERLARYREVIDSLASLRDPNDWTTPTDLHTRTIARLASVLTDQEPLPRYKPKLTPAALAKMVQVDQANPVPASRTTIWRRVDVVLAVCAVALFVALGLAALGELHRKYQVMQCQNNLRQLFLALTDYAIRTDERFPQIPADPPDNRASVFVQLLLERGSLLSTAITVCPAEASAVPFAYSLGYRDQDGHLRALRRSQLDQPSGYDLLPLAADYPSQCLASATLVLHTAHGTSGNVLFVGGQVRLCRHANVGLNNDDIYRNLAGQVRAGLHWADTVLGRGDDSP